MMEKIFIIKFLRRAFDSMVELNDQGQPVNLVANRQKKEMCLEISSLEFIRGSDHGNLPLPI